MVSRNDLCDRSPVPADALALDIGGHLLRLVATPHVPHNGESGVWFDETTKTLLGGDLFTALGDGPAVVDSDLVDGAIVAEDVVHASSLSAAIPATLRSLADLEPETIASCTHRHSVVTAPGRAGGWPRPTKLCSDADPAGRVASSADGKQ
jgi:flavorubredoxin